MLSEHVISIDNPQASLENVGGKGSSLARLVNAGLPVPGGFHITTTAYRQFIAENDLQPRILAALEHIDLAIPATLEQASLEISSQFNGAFIPANIASDIVQAYAALPGNKPAVAVRSSATAEDLPEASFAGQQETYLNVSGADAVLEAVKKCWASLWTARAISYRARQGIAPEGVALAVVVQMLIPADAAGILFTANPINGRRDQAVISASWGLGEAIVGGLVTPDSFTTDKSSGRVLESQIAAKQIMTVRVNGGTQEQPVPANLQQVPALNDDAADKLTRLAVQIENLYGMPMDIEWALHDGDFAIVQARPITALPEEQFPAPTEWPMPNPKGHYMRASIVELLPDPLSPLFATLGVEAINRGIGVMGKDLFKTDVDIFSGLMLTINGYAYEQASFTPGQWWQLLTRMIPAFPRMLREGVPYWRDVAHPRYVAVVESWSNQSISELPPSELLEGIHEILDAFGHHLGSLMASTMGPSAGSEGAFTQVYEKMIRRKGDPEAPVFLMGFNSLPIQGEKALYDLAEWCREREDLAAYLAKTPAEQLITQMKTDMSPMGISEAEWIQWQARFDDYMTKYGYSIYDMDFAKYLPAEQPGPILETLRLFINQPAKSPYERQQNYEQRRKNAEANVRERVKGIKRWAFEKSLKWAQSQAPLREDGIAEIGLGYPILRRMLLELGRRFVIGGAIQEADDIFWLEQKELDTLVTALKNGDVLTPKMEVTNQRKALWKARKRVTPPSQLPTGKKYMGFDMESLLAGGLGAEEGNIIKGVPASNGQVTAKACVLHGPEDFDQMQPGNILVASITTPAWTPLFAMAAGIVTDVGGPLSHSSIVAREYGIPAVLGTGIATRRIQNKQSVTVDGDAGTVELHN